LSLLVDVIKGEKERWDSGVEKRESDETAAGIERISARLVGDVVMIKIKIPEERRVAPEPVFPRPKETLLIPLALGRLCHKSVIGSDPAIVGLKFEIPAPQERSYFKRGIALILSPLGPIIVAPPELDQPAHPVEDLEFGIEKEDVVSLRHQLVRVIDLVEGQDIPRAQEKARQDAVGRFESIEILPGRVVNLSKKTGDPCHLTSENVGLGPRSIEIALIAPEVDARVELIGEAFRKVREGNGRVPQAGIEDGVVDPEPGQF
jgi:hypothetical protein